MVPKFDHERIFECITMTDTTDTDYDIPSNGTSSFLGLNKIRTGAGSVFDSSKGNTVCVLPASERLYHR